VEHFHIQISQFLVLEFGMSPRVNQDVVLFIVADNPRFLAVENFDETIDNLWI